MFQNLLAKTYIVLLPEREGESLLRDREREREIERREREREREREDERCYEIGFVLVT